MSTAIVEPSGGQEAGAVAEERKKPSAASREGAAAGSVAGNADADSALVEATPLYADNPPPVYPPLARRRGWEGQVLLRVTVGRDGRVEGLELERSSTHRLLDRAALEAVRRWRFRPARRGDRAVADEVLVPIHFRLERGGGAAFRRF